MKLHKKIRKLMQKHGYAISGKGVCAGIGGVGIHAILLRDTSRFNHRLEILKASKQYTDEFILHEMLPFFESIYLIQYPEIVKELSSDKNLSGAELVAPYALKEKGGSVKVGQFSGVYTADSLKSLLDEIAEKLNELPDTIVPVAFSLGSGTHVISLGYDRSTRQWMMIDANQLLIETDELAKAVIAGFLANHYQGVKKAREAIEQSPDLTAAFSSQVYTVGDDQEIIKAHLDLFFQTQVSKNALKKDTRDFSLARIAAAYNDVERVNFLLEQRMLSNEDIKKMLLIAIKREQDQIIEIIWDHVNMSPYFSFSLQLKYDLILFSIKKNNAEMFFSFLENTTLSEPQLKEIFLIVLKEKQDKLIDYFFKKVRFSFPVVIKMACFAAKINEDATASNFLKQVVWYDPRNGLPLFLISLIQQRDNQLFNKWLARCTQLSTQNLTLLFSSVAKTDNSAAIIKLITHQNFNDQLRTLEKKLPFELLFDINSPLFEEVLMALLNECSRQKELKQAIARYLSGESDALKEFAKLNSMVKQSKMEIDQFAALIKNTPYFSKESYPWISFFPLFHDCLSSTTEALTV